MTVTSPVYMPTRATDIESKGSNLHFLTLQYYFVKIDDEDLIVRKKNFFIIVLINLLSSLLN